VDFTGCGDGTTGAGLSAGEPHAIQIRDSGCEDGKKAERIVTTDRYAVAISVSDCAPLIPPS
jgi:hypothetical protein